MPRVWERGAKGKGLVLSFVFQPQLKRGLAGERDAHREGAEATGGHSAAMGRLGSMGQALADRLSRRNQRATVFEELLPDDAEGPPAPASNGMPPAESAPPPVQAVPAAGVPASGGFAELMQQLVREATRNRLKAPDQVAMANVWSFVSNRDGDPLVVDHLVRELAVKLHSNKPQDFWVRGGVALLLELSD